MPLDPRAGITLHISVAPPDAAHAEPILQHQMRVWAGQVDEVLFTVDVRPSPGSYARNWDRNRDELDRVLAEVCQAHDHARVAPVDYGPARASQISQRFLGGRPAPAKDCNGTPIYGYFFGLIEAQHRFVLHADSDMLFGGGSQTWVAEARRLLTECPEVFCCSPLPGPPTADGTIPASVLPRHQRGMSGSAPGQAVVPFSLPWLGGPAFRFPHLSSRLFMLDTSRLRNWTVRPIRPSLRSTLNALALGNPRYSPIEVAISEEMMRREVSRIDFLGSPPGMWSLHPPLRSNLFYRQLPDIIRRIELGDVPDAQRGDYDLNSSMIDWSSALAAQRRARHRKVFARLMR